MITIPTCMLTIRKEQITRLSASQNAEYHARLASFLREKLPSETDKLGERGLLEFIAETTAHAARFGIKTGEGVVAFVAMALLISRTFYEDPAVNRYLARPDLDADFKMTLLTDMLRSKFGGGK